MWVLSLSPANSAELATAQREPMANRKYEAFYIVRPTLTDEEVQKVADRFKKVVEDKSGLVEKAGKWDKRKLAYEIGDLKEGIYIQMNFESDPTVISELNRLMRISDDVVRHTILKLED